MTQRDSLERVTYHGVQTYRGTGAEVTTETSTDREALSFLFKEDTRWAAQRKKILSGRNATTRLYGWKYRVHSFSPGFTAMSTSTVPGQPDWFATYWGFPDIYSFPVPSSVVDPEVNNLALQRLNRALRQKEQSFDGLTFTGELRESLHLIRHSASRLASLLLQRELKLSKKLRPKPGPTRRSRKDRAARAAKSASDSWLEAMFGWSPIFSDIDSAMKALGYRPKRSSPGTLIPIYGQAKRIDQSVEERFQTSHAGIVNKFLLSVVNSFEVKYYGRYRVRPVSSSSEWRHWGFDLKNVLPAAWELTPWSFVWDYFTNIGDIVDAWSQGTSDLAWLSRTFVNRKDLMVTGHWFDGISPGYGNFLESLSHTGAQLHLSGSYTDRAQYEGTTVPSLEFQVPGAKAFANLVALSASRLPTSKGPAQSRARKVAFMDMTRALQKGPAYLR